MTERSKKQNDQIHKKNKSAPRSFSSLKCVLILLFSIVLPVLFTGYISFNINNLQKLDPVKYFDVIVDAPSYKWFKMEKFFSDNHVKIFIDMFLSGETLSTVIEDSNSKNVESAGEAVGIGHLDCKHPFMTLNLNRTMCHFSNRLDVGMHFVKTGGFNGYIEYFDRAVARILPFRKRIITNKINFDPFDFKILEEFNTPDFLNNVKSICLDKSGDSKATSNANIINEMYQLDLLLMLPGQELPMHLNVPYFMGAQRNTVPQWLLVAMKRSKLFDHLYIHQTQGLVEIKLDHELIEKQTETETENEMYVDISGDGGDFYLYPYLPYKTNINENENKEKHYENENINKYVILKSKHNSAILLDGAQVIHGVDRFKPNELPPLFAANHHYNIRYDDKSQTWVLVDSKNNYLKNYRKTDVKLFIVWNQHCFESQLHKTKFETAKPLTLDEIAHVFKENLKSKKRLPSEDISLLELWTIVLKEYLSYPVNTHNQNSTIFGFNYCLLPNIMPKWVTDKFLKNVLLKRC